ncbi:sugar ABC transporter ATP-binding protein [Arundinibacter roseus]|uniref:Sugar ABC transporter ATP-binding protein n=1 Tax=Arundinibacter roseus TaxID=2070510 RepID=A0A4R4JZM9_9BACT|nr:sugar ABC transporter ATP-binding protein [Arundinibacter roseus]TDB60420.1 sugar ABC transporter ATP-binding protein [Arundinibacter roseus]
MSAPQTYILQVSNLHKSFGGIKALDGVQLSLQRGEVLALMGENGAGKSTLMKILIGLESADSGEILFEGKPLKSSNVKQTLDRGISMIHQEILMVPELTVAENIFLGRETTRWLPGWVDDRHMYHQTDLLLAELGLTLSARTKMKYLSVAERQMVEIAKAISNNARIIIMDEPTSALSDKEVTTLFRIIRDLKAQGVAIIYISHKMEEIAQVADTITVLRDGRYIATKPAAELDKESLIALMVGRQIDQLFPEATTQKGETVLSVRNLSRAGAFSDISFDIRAGEVLGLAGLMGAGRTEVARVIYGLDAATAGEIFLKGQKVAVHSPQDAIRHGIGYLSEDRKALGCIPGMSVQHTLTLSSLARFATWGFIEATNEQETARRTVSELHVKTSGLDQGVMQLSGGNQQKVVLGKVLLANPDVVMFDEPTRGIDIGAKHEIYKLIRQLTARGIAVLLISSELPEIIGLCDRVLVLSQGRQTALLSGQEANPERIMQYAVPA